jgi:hypothetical protein
MSGSALVHLYIMLQVLVPSVFSAFFWNFQLLASHYFICGILTKFDETKRLKNILEKLLKMFDDYLRPITQPLFAQENKVKILIFQKSKISK